jgi:hypothetical protein
LAISPTSHARVEGWIADHPRHALAQKMRVACARQWSAISSRAIESFDHSRQNPRTSKERSARRKNVLACDGFMTGTPIRSVAFIEAAARMRLVIDSFARRREFRLADVDKLLFGNKIVGE